MTDMLGREAFLSWCQRLLEPHNLFGVARCVTERIDVPDVRFGYYFNPHLVFTRILRFASENEPRLYQAIQEWCRQATVAFQECQAAPTVPDQNLGGVPAGQAHHDELYFEARAGEHACSLHQQGCSFRLRVTTQTRGEDPYTNRVLMVLTRYPVRADHSGAIGDKNAWTHLDTERFPAFAPLVPLRAALARSTALPSVVECLVAYLPKDLMVHTLLDDLEAQWRTGDVRVVARFHKTSSKFDLRKWRQNPVNGEMDPAWSYLAIDHIRGQLASTLQAIAPEPTSWHDLRQAEFEVGPHPDMVAAALDLVSRLDEQLQGVAEEVRPTWGRKIHRLLQETGTGS